MKNAKLALYLLLTLLNSNLAQAKSQSAEALTTEFKNGIFVGSLKAGYHFNNKAPNRIVIESVTIKPGKITNSEIRFEKLPTTLASGQAFLYVCDDAVTFCESHTIPLSQKNVSNHSKTNNANPRKGKVNAHGFIEDDLQKAIELAKKNSKLILIDFSARWCPGCLRYENETFDTQAFKDLTKRLVKVKLDVDRFENSILADKFKVKAIPTLLLITTEQEEIDRLIDYQPFEIVTPFFTKINQDPTTISSLKEKAAKGDSSVYHTLGQRLVMSGNFEESIPYLEKVKPQPSELNYASVKSAETRFNANKNLKSDYIAVLKRVIREEPKSSRSIDWRTRLIGLVDSPKEKTKILTEGIATAEELLSDKTKLLEGVKTDLVGEFTGFERLYVSILQSDLVEAANDPQFDVQEAWKKTAAIGREAKVPVNQKGPALRFLIVLVQAKLFEEANEVADKLLAKYKNDGDIQRRKLKILVELKKYPEAIALGTKSLTNSYARNEFWVAEALAKAYIGAKENKRALDLIDLYLSKPDSDWATIVSTKKSFEDLRKQAMHSLPQ